MSEDYETLWLEEVGKRRALEAENKRLREFAERIAATTWPPGFSISAAQGMIAEARQLLAHDEDRPTLSTKEDG